MRKPIKTGTNIRSVNRTPLVGEIVRVSGYAFEVTEILDRQPNPVSGGWDWLTFMGRDVHTSRSIL